MDFTLPTTPTDAFQQIQELMIITKRPRGFKTFKKFRQSRDIHIKGLFQFIRTWKFPTGSKIKRANGKTYEVQPDGSFQRWSPPLEKNWPAH